jgi:hypothetical protein
LTADERAADGRVERRPRGFVDVGAQRLAQTVVERASPDQRFLERIPRVVNGWVYKTASVGQGAWPPVWLEKRSVPKSSGTARPDPWKIRFDHSQAQGGMKAGYEKSPVPGVSFPRAAV